MIKELLEKGITFSLEFVPLERATPGGDQLGLLLTFRKGIKVIESFETIPSIEVFTENKDFEEFILLNFGIIIDNIDECFENYDCIFSIPDDVDTIANQNFED